MLYDHHLRATTLILVLIAVGCSKDDLSGALDKAKNAVTENTAKAKQAVQAKLKTTTQQVQEQLNLAGSIELTAGDPLVTDACYVSFIPQGSGRPTVLQLRSYGDVARETFPSVFIQAHVQANSLTELIGEPLSARLFVQRESEGPVLYSDDSTPIELKITSVEGELVSAELARATLRETTTGAEILTTGKLTGVLD